MFLGLELQRSFSANTLRGVHQDPGCVIKALAGRIRAEAPLIDTKGK
jgi:hypothetical protein